MATFVGAAPAQGATIDFEGLAPGSIVDEPAPGVRVSGVSLSDGPDEAILFDSQGGGAVDPDLQGPAWSGGNIAGEELGNLLILPENLDGVGDDGLVDVPNDEGSNPAGFMVFGFDVPVTDFGLDIIDIEPGNSESVTISFFSEGDVVGVLRDDDLLARDGSIQFGDNTANRVSPIAAPEFGASSFDQVQVSLGGSGAVDNVSFTLIPEPGTAALLLFGLAGLARAGHRRA